MTVKTTLGGSERPGHGRRRPSRRKPSRPRRCPRERAGVARGSAQGDPSDQPVRLCPAPGHRQARVGRDDRRDPDGRAVALGRDRRGLAVGAGPAQGRRQGDAGRSAWRARSARRAGDGARGSTRRCTSTSSTTSRRCSRGWAATRGPATARPRARTASSSRSAAMTRSSTSGRLTDDHAARHVNLASPDDSMMLLKPTGAVPHVGGALDPAGRAVLRDHPLWIADGAKLDLTTPRVTKIEVFPVNPIVQRIGGKQQLRVLATYAERRGPRRHPRGVPRERQLPRSPRPAAPG